MRKPRWLMVPAVLAVVGVVAGCGGSAGSVGGGSSGRLQVVAAENFWGSIARQLGGTKVSVQSIIVNPDTDPHSYEPTAADGIALAKSQMAIVNGIGYDAWASKLIDANPSSARTVLNVGDLLGLKEGDNAHQWYSPSSVRRVIDQIVADYKRRDAKDSAYFDQQRTAFETKGLAEYHRLIAGIRSRYAGVPVGYSESIFQPLGAALGLKLLTPYSFAKAIAEGTDVSAADTQKPSMRRRSSGRSRCGSTTARTRHQTCSASMRSRARLGSRSRRSPRRSRRRALASSSGKSRS